MFMGILGNGRKYDRCKHKSVKIVNYYKLRSASSNIYSAIRPDKLDDYEMGLVGILSCPLTRLHGNQVNSHVGNLAGQSHSDLREIASESICMSCSISRKSPTAVELDEAEQIAAKAQRIEAQNRLKKAEAETKRLIALGMPEVDKINRKNGLSDND